MRSGALEGKFSVKNKSPGHPHTNMAKAALNMMTHTACKAEWLRESGFIRQVEAQLSKSRVSALLLGHVSSSDFDELRQQPSEAQAKQTSLSGSKDLTRFATEVDTGWVTDMAPGGVGAVAASHETWVGPPLDEEDVPNQCSALVCGCAVYAVASRIPK